MKATLILVDGKMIDPSLVDTKSLYFTTAEAMFLLKQSRRSLYRRRMQKEITFFKIGAKILYPRQAVIDLHLQANGKRPDWDTGDDNRV